MNIEFQHGPKFKITKSNPLVGPTENMEDVEYWEDRLLKLDVPFVIAYRQLSNKVFYFIYVKI